MTLSTPVDTDVIEADSSSIELSRAEFAAVLEKAIALGWCSPVVCSTHDGVPLTEEEDEEFIEGHDPCAFVIRIYDED